MSTINWKVPPPIHDDNSTTPIDNWEVPPSVHDNNPTNTDRKVRPSAHDDNSTKKALTNWKVPSSFGDDNSFNDDSSFDNPFENDNPFDNDNPTKTNWKVQDTPSFHADNLTKTIPADWKDTPSFHDDSATRATPTDNWKIFPLINDDNSSKPISIDNPEVLPSIHYDNSLKTLPTDNPKAPPSIHDDNSLKTIPTYTPYLQLPHLLSLTWLAYPIISLIFVAFRLQLSLVSAENGLVAAQNDILSSCNAAQKAATGTASLPRYLALASNQRVADAANGSMEAARAALILSLDVLESTLNFFIDFYRSTLLCFIGLAVQGGLSLVIDAVKALATPLQSVSSKIESEVTSANSALTSAVSSFNKANPVHPITLPSISIADLSSLQNLTIPSSFQNSLTSLNSSVPTPVNIKSIIDNLLDTPFELLKKSINETFSNLTFDPKVFPVPAENRLSFCNDLNLSAIDDIKSNLIKTARIGSLILIGLALLLIGLNCLVVWLRWRSMKKHLERVRQAWASDPTSRSEPQFDVHARSFPSTPQNSTFSGKHTKSSGSDSQTDVQSRAFPSTPQNITLSEKHTKSSEPEAQMDVHTRSFSSVPQKITLSDSTLKHTKSSGSEPQMDGYTRSFPSTPQNLTLSEKHTKSSEPEPQMDAHTRPFPSTPQNLTLSEKHTKSSEPEPQMDAHTRPFPSTPQNLTLSKKHTKSSEPEPQMDAHTRPFPSTPQNLTLSEKHAKFSVSAPQMGGHTRFSPSAPQITLSDHNLLMLQADSEHPFITRITNSLAARTGMTPSQQIDMRWFFHYVFHPPALACFLIGFFGLLSVMIQLLILGPLVSAARAGVEGVVSDFSGNIAHSINQSMYNQSSAYANDINSRVDVVQSAINNGLFGWVNGTTTLLNDNMNKFYTEVQNLVSSLFNGTILEAPALGFVQCLIGNKINDIEQALTFLQNNLFITIPRVSEDVLVLSGQTVNEATAPIASAAVGNGSGNQGLIGGAVDLYANSLRSEAIVFSIFMGIWGLVVSMAICVLLWRSHKRKRVVAAAKRQRLSLEERDKHVEANTFSPLNDKKEDLWMD